MPNGITINSGMICGVIAAADLKKYKNYLNAMIYKAASGPLGALAAAAAGMAGSVVNGQLTSLTHLQNKVSAAVNKMVNAILNVANDVAALIKCFGVDIFAKLGFDPRGLLSAGVLCPNFITALINNITTIIKSAINGIIGGIVSAVEGAISGVMSLINDLMDMAYLNEIFAVLKCIGKCGGGSAPPIDHAAASSMLSNVGLTPMYDTSGRMTGMRSSPDWSQVDWSTYQAQAISQIRAQVGNPTYNPTNQEVQAIYTQWKAQADAHAQSMFDIQNNAISSTISQTAAGLSNSAYGAIDGVKKCLSNLKAKGAQVYGWARDSVKYIEYSGGLIMNVAESLTTGDVIAPNNSSYTYDPKTGLWIVNNAVG